MKQMIEVVPIENLEDFCNAIKDDEYRALYLLTLFCGMDWRQIARLRWDSIDYATQEITVDKGCMTEYKIVVGEDVLLALQQRYEIVKNSGLISTAYTQKIPRGDYKGKTPAQVLLNDPQGREKLRRMIENITRLGFASFIKSYGIKDLAEKIRTSLEDVFIEDMSTFVIYETDKDTDTEYPVRYSIEYSDKSEETNAMQLKVTSRIDDQEGEAENEVIYDVPEGMPEYPIGEEIKIIERSISMSAENLKIINAIKDAIALFDEGKLFESDTMGKYVFSNEKHDDFIDYDFAKSHLAEIASRIHRFDINMKSLRRAFCIYFLVFNDINIDLLSRIMHESKQQIIKAYIEGATLVQADSLARIKEYKDTNVIKQITSVQLPDEDEEM